MSEYELYHHGIKGMKWGVRRKKNVVSTKTQNKSPYSHYMPRKSERQKRFEDDNGFNPNRPNRTDNSVVNKYYSDKQRKRDRAFYGARGEKRINKKLNEGHGLLGARHYEVERKERSEKTRKMIKKGVKKTATILSSIGTAYLYDQAFNNGVLTNVVKSTVKTAGRVAVSAYMKARGGYDIRWYDN